MKIFVYHTPESTPEQKIPDCAVVIDVLRATTTITSALHHGAKSVRAFSDIELLLQASESIPSAQRLRLGERGGKKVESCDLGNSPLDCTAEMVKDKQLFISTTNGTRALTKVSQAPTVLIGALTNFSAVVKYLKTEQPEEVWLLGSGWQGGYSLEDTVCAGAIARELVDLGDVATIGNDEVLSALSLYTAWENDLEKLLTLASHGQRLLKLNLEDDLRYCAQQNIISTLPKQQEKGSLIFTV